MTLAFAALVGIMVAVLAGSVFQDGKSAFAVAQPGTLTNGAPQQWAATGADHAAQISDTGVCGTDVTYVAGDNDNDDDRFDVDLTSLAVIPANATINSVDAAVCDENINQAGGSSTYRFYAIVNGGSKFYSSSRGPGAKTTATLAADPTDLLKSALTSLSVGVEKNNSQDIARVYQLAIVVNYTLAAPSGELPQA